MPTVTPRGSGERKRGSGDYCRKPCKRRNKAVQDGPHPRLRAAAGFPKIPTLRCRPPTPLKKKLKSVLCFLQRTNKARIDILGTVFGKKCRENPAYTTAPWCWDTHAAGNWEPRTNKNKKHSQLRRYHSQPSVLRGSSARSRCQRRDQEQQPLEQEIHPAPLMPPTPLSPPMRAGHGWYTRKKERC